VRKCSRGETKKRSEEGEPVRVVALYTYRNTSEILKKRTSWEGGGEGGMDCLKRSLSKGPVIRNPIGEEIDALS